MAEKLHLEQAAKQSGKSEITLRRLIKAEKIPFEKEPTLTGFVYLVDPEDVIAYYGKRGTTQSVAAPAPVSAQEDEPALSVSNDQPEAAEAPEEPEVPEEAQEVQASIEEEQPGQEPVVEPVQSAYRKEGAEVRITRPVVGAEVGGPTDYWRKRAEVLEQRLNQEMAEHVQLAKELEDLRSQVGKTVKKSAQVVTTPVKAAEPAPEKKTFQTKTGDTVMEEVPPVSVAAVIGWTFGILVFLAALGGILYWFYTNLR